MAESIQFFPTWMLVAQWKNVHPYTRPNEIDPRVSSLLCNYRFTMFCFILDKYL